ncbi:hypothetical protein [Mycobacteroides sp. LB1]|uniref:hypothetical protein n=1 Tax=Mycobacteroides sp. LB1 TaxID=2750814 RepID=UPI0015E05B3D|nr:hypothetical protein [Mycobacteroides sp. LB1]
MTTRTRGAALMAALAFLFSIVMGAAPRALADPIQPPPPKPIPYPVAQPDDLPRIAPIGGAQVKTNTPLGMGPGTGRPLAAGRERSNATISPSPTDGTHLPTAIAGKDVVLHLPQERELTPAQWGDGGSATFTSRDTDYRISPFAGGGADVNIIRRTIFTPENFTFGLRVPEGTHVRQGANVVLVESDAAPGLPATTIATLSVPVARDAKGNPVQVTPVIHGDYMYQQSNLALDLGPADIFAFPITITLSYRASSIPASGQLATDWEGLPEGGGPPEAKKAAQIIGAPGDYVVDPGGSYRPASVDPVLYGQRHADRCLSGPNEFRSEDGRSTDFWSSCQRQAMCLDVTPAQMSVDVCNNQAFANMSAQCTATFGQTGPEYDACLNVANGHSVWSKANLLGGWLCQPVGPGTNTRFLPSNNNRYCS